MHDRVWLAWMDFDYDTDIDGDGDAVWWIEQDSQHVQMLEDHAGSQSWQVLFGGSVAPHDRQGAK